MRDNLDNDRRCCCRAGQGRAGQGSATICRYCCRPVQLMCISAKFPFLLLSLLLTLYRMPSHPKGNGKHLGDGQGLPKLVWPLLVHPVGISLVDVHQEDQVVSEHTQAVQPGHLDDKGEEVIYDGVQELVGHLAPGQGCHTLQLVVDVQLQRQGVESDV